MCRQSLVDGAAGYIVVTILLILDQHLHWRAGAGAEATDGMVVAEQSRLIYIRRFKVIASNQEVF